MVSVSSLAPVSLVVRLTFHFESINGSLFRAIAKVPCRQRGNRAHRENGQRGIDLLGARAGMGEGDLQALHLIRGHTELERRVADFPREGKERFDALLRANDGDMSGLCRYSRVALFRRSDP